MQLYVTILTWLTLLGHHATQSSNTRGKRDAAGALQIVNNHAQPIHADVKPEVISAPIVTEKQSSNTRGKRDAAGALQIVNNHAQPIHADVKPEVISAPVLTEKPCPSNQSLPSHVESGVTFKVTPPEDTFYQATSFRKSLVHFSKLEFARSISRVFTLAVLLISAVFEFYPLLSNLYNMMYSFLYL